MNTRIPVRRHRVGDSVWHVERPGIIGTVVERGELDLTVTWPDGSTSVERIIRMVNCAW